MAKLYFYYSAMNAGKSTTLLQSAHNYRERGMKPVLLTPKFDDRAGVGKIASRIGISADATTFQHDDNLLAYINAVHQDIGINCVLVDEAQFLTETQVWQLSDVVDRLNIPVLTYGIRTDFRGQAFPGSAALLSTADNLIEIKTVCHCGRKATHTLRVDAHNQVISEGDQVEVGGNERYVSVCRQHFKAKQSSANKQAQQHVEAVL